MSDEFPIRPLGPDELDPGLIATLGARVADRGYDDLPVLFRILARQPDGYARMVQMAAAVERDLGRGVIEACCITAAIVSDCPWVRVTHENKAVGSGLSADWVRDVRRCDPTPERAPSLGDDERVAQRLCLAMLRTRPEAADVLREIAGSRGDTYAVALMMLIGYYAMGTTMTRLLDLPLPPPAVPDDPA